MLSYFLVGPAASRRGDVIRCTVMFEDKRERSGKVQVPVVFTVNGSRIIPDRDQTYVEFSPEKPRHPYIALGYGNSVLAKVKLTILQF